MGGVGDDRVVRVPHNPIGDLRSGRHQRRLATSGQRQQPRGDIGPRGEGPSRRALEHHVGVGAAHAERADPGHAVGPGPGLQGRGDGRSKRIEIDPRIESLEVQVRRDRAVVESQRHLDHPSDPCGAFEVSDVGLDRADREPPVGGTTLGEGGAQRAELDRIPQRRAGAVGLHVRHVRRGHRRVGQRRADHRLLRLCARHGEAAARPVVVHRRASNGRDDAVAGVDRVAEALEHHHAAAFTTAVAIGGGVEGLAPAVRRHRPQSRRDHVHAWRQQQADATGDRHVTLAGAQTPHCKVG